MRSDVQTPHTLQELNQIAAGIFIIDMGRIVGDLVTIGTLAPVSALLFFGAITLGFTISEVAICGTRIISYRPQSSDDGVPCGSDSTNGIGGLDTKAGISVGSAGPGGHSIYCNTAHRSRCAGNRCGLLLLGRVSNPIKPALIQSDSNGTDLPDDFPIRAC